MADGFEPGDHPEGSGTRSHRGRSGQVPENGVRPMQCEGAHRARPVEPYSPDRADLVSSGDEVDSDLIPRATWPGNFWGAVGEGQPSLSALSASVVNLNAMK